MRPADTSLVFSKGRLEKKKKKSHDEAGLEGLWQHRPETRRLVASDRAPRKLPHARVEGRRFMASNNAHDVGRVVCNPGLGDEGRLLLPSKDALEEIERHHAEVGA